MMNPEVPTGLRCSTVGDVEDMLPEAGDVATKVSASAHAATDDEFAAFDELVTLEAHPVVRAPLTAQEERALMRDLDEYDEARARAEVESRGLFIGRATAR